MNMRCVIHRGRDVIILCAAAAMVSACDTTQEWTAPPCPKVFTIVSGNHQTGAVNTPLAEPLRVRPDVSGEETMFCFVWMAQVTWSVELGGGTIVPSGNPGVEGYTAVWTLGPTVGRQTVRATWTPSRNEGAHSVRFEATANGPP